MPRASKAEEVTGSGDAADLSTAAATTHAASVRMAAWLCAGSIAVSLGLRVLYLAQVSRIDLSEHPVFIDDEGVLGLMARHILAGAHPLFYYGQYYLGALEAYLTAGVFEFFGESMTTLRVVPTLFALSWIPLTGAIASRLYGKRAAFLAVALVALPSQFVFEWGFKARGGFAEHVTFLLLVVDLVLRLQERITAPRLAALGFIAGLSLWVNQLSVAYLPIYGYALFAWVPLRRRHLGIMLVAGLVGAAPLIYGNIINPLGTVRALITEVKSSWRLEQVAKADPEQVREYRAVPLLQVLGAQDRRDGSWSVSGTVGAIFLTLGCVGAVWRGCWRGRNNAVALRRHLLLFGFVGATLVVGMAGFSGQPVGRYQLVLYPLLCILAVGWLDAASPRWAIPVVALLALGQAIQLTIPTPSDGRTPREVINEALTRHDLHYGYGAGFMYDLVFQSGERIIIEPVERSRYPAYQAAVGSAARTFYIYRDDQERKTAHQAFVKYLSDTGVTSKRFDLNEYHVLYDFVPPGSISTQAMTKLRHDIQNLKGRDNG
jgi:hypothetical protein